MWLIVSMQSREWRWIPKPYTDTISPQPASFTVRLKTEGQRKGRGEAGESVAKWRKLETKDEKRWSKSVRITSQCCHWRKGQDWVKHREDKGSMKWDGELGEMSVCEGCYQIYYVTLWLCLGMFHVKKVSLHSHQICPSMWCSHKHKYQSYY